MLPLQEKKKLKKIKIILAGKEIYTVRFVKTSCFKEVLRTWKAKIAATLQMFRD